MRQTISIVTLALLAACAGKDGTTGPTGPQGATGASGPPGQAGAAGAGTRVTFTTTIGSDRTASFALPAAAGSNAGLPPLLACYVKDTPNSTVYYAVADGFSASSPYCTLTLFLGWTARIQQGTPGMVAVFVVIY